MKKTLCTALILALGTGIAQANDMQQADKKNMLVMADSKQASTSMNNKAAMEPMTDTMHKMQMQMEAIRQTQDPAKRQTMMQEHMRMMKDGMGMMRNMMGNNMQKSTRGGETARMDMMQQMMDQMMQHMEAM